MEVNLNANICDAATYQIAERLRNVFEMIEKEISSDYGGTMQYLWIDFELSKFNADHRPPYPFRFQKKVGGGISRLTGLRTAVYENVGHYSVRPDFEKLLKLPIDSVPSYALSLIFHSTAVLIEKKKKLGGFDVESFRSNFLSSCKKLGYDIEKIIS